MTGSAESRFIRYLTSKRSIDDRALNYRVWSTLATRLARAQSGQHPFTVLEIGAGIGTMLERMLEERLLPACRYALLDADAANCQMIPTRLADWAAAHFGTLTAAVQPAPFHPVPSAAHRLTAPAAPVVDTYTYHQDLFTFLDAVIDHPMIDHPAVDLLVAHAFMDLVDVPSTLTRIKAVLRPGALLYLTINFDGGTILQPEIDPELDPLIERLYHATMDRRIVAGRPSGDSRTGRHLFGRLNSAGIQVLDAGSSDWIVFPQRNTYPADEAYFLHFIIQTMDGALRDNPALNPDRFAAWVAARHRQIDAGELVYIAHQLDILGLYPG